MNIWMFLVILIPLMILMGAFAMRMVKKQNELLKKYPGYPKGYFKSQGMGLGIAIGAGLGVAIGNIAMGVAIGVALGAAIGSSKEAKHKDDIRPVTEEEKALRKQKFVFISGILLAGLLVFLLVYFLSN